MRRTELLTGLILGAIATAGVSGLLIKKAKKQSDALLDECANLERIMDEADYFSKNESLSKVLEDKDNVRMMSYFHRGIMEKNLINKREFDKADKYTRATGEMVSDWVNEDGSETIYKLVEFYDLVKTISAKTQQERSDLIALFLNRDIEDIENNKRTFKAFKKKDGRMVLTVWDNEDLELYNEYLTEYEWRAVKAMIRDLLNK